MMRSELILKMILLEKISWIKLNHFQISFTAVFLLSGFQFFRLIFLIPQSLHFIVSVEPPGPKL